jgi:hypothetical protein
MTKRRHEDETTSSSTVTMFVMAVGGILVLGLVGWALTRSVEPAAPAPPPPALAASSTSAPVTTSTHRQDDDRAAVPRVDVESLSAMIQRNEVTVIDVRDEVAFVTEHIPGSLHVPFARIQAEASRIPKTKRVVLYCT